MPKKQPKPKAARPQFDAATLDEIDGDEQTPFTLDDDGTMVLRRSRKPPRKGVSRGKGKSPKPGR